MESLSCGVAVAAAPVSGRRSRRDRLKRRVNQVREGKAAELFELVMHAFDGADVFLARGNVSQANGADLKDRCEEDGDDDSSHQDFYKSGGSFGRSRPHAHHSNYQQRPCHLACEVQQPSMARPASKRPDPISTDPAHESQRWRKTGKQAAGPLRGWRRNTES